MVLDTGKSIFVTGQDICDTGKWSWIQVNPFLILVSGLGYW